MLEVSSRGAIIYASGEEERTISRHFDPNESGTLLEYVLDSVWTVVDEIFVVFPSAEPRLSIVESISPFGARVLATSEGSSPLKTIYEAFRSSKSEHCLLTTERVPLLKPNVALALFENAQGYDLAIPSWGSKRNEPMLAVYRRNAFVRLLGSSKSSLMESKPNSHGADEVKSQLASLVEQLFSVKLVKVETELRELDPELDSFLEVKDEKSLQLARSKASVKAKRILRQGK
jgi:molybdopterin-guanine dinucleotide biosynthesis protein A